MSGYVFVEIVSVSDPEKYARYRELAPPIIKAAGGTYLFRGGDPEVLEGDWSPNRVVVLRFPTRAAARSWWESDAYAAVRRLREESTHSRMILVEGTEGVPV
jgi:uncharacterized protein (DUF1330 family)